MGGGPPSSWCGGERHWAGSTALSLAHALPSAAPASAAATKRARRARITFRASSLMLLGVSRRIVGRHNRVTDLGVDLLVGLGILALLAVPFWVAVSRSNELFVIEVQAGVPRAVRGRLPQRLLDDLADVVERPRLASARFKVVVEDRRARLVVLRGDIPAGQLQQLRNVVGTYPVAAIRAGGKVRG